MWKLLISILFLCTSLVTANTPDFIRECMDCHGENGVSLEPDMPTIAGASAVFIEETFSAYKYDMRYTVKSKYRLGDTSRKPTDMKEIGEKLSDEQIQQAAEFFAKLPFVAAKQEFDAALVEKGKTIHDMSCEKCHRDGGTSPVDDAGILAGQWTPYLRNSVKYIINDSRDIDENMSRKVKKLTPDEWEALFNYYASQQGK